LQVVRAHQVRELALAGPAQDLHLKEAVLGLGVTDPERSPVQNRLLARSVGEDVRHPGAVADDRQPRLRLLAGNSAGHVLGRRSQSPVAKAPVQVEAELVAEVWTQ